MHMKFEGKGFPKVSGAVIPVSSFTTYLRWEYVIIVNFRLNPTQSESQIKADEAT